MRCPKCERENPEDNLYCGKCGTALAGPATRTDIAGDAGAVLSGQFADQVRVTIPTTAEVAGNKNFLVQGTQNVVNYLTQVFQAPAEKTLPQAEALHRYLDYQIDTHQHLRLQGIRAGSQPLSVDLEKVYVSLRIVAQHGRASGEAFTLATALQQHRRLVIIGDPGSGKTTLLAYLALTYARTLRDGGAQVAERLQLQEPTHLPILLPLRDLGGHLRGTDAGKDGAATLLGYLRDYYAAQEIRVPEDFFAAPLEQGQAVVLLDGMDELADPALRQRVARLIEKFAVRYPKARYVVTSRKVGYEGAARVGAGFALAEVREFERAQMRQFVRDWTRVVEVKLAERESPDILNAADKQAERLIAAIERSPRVLDLAVNPLLLTVIALVHRYRATLPERRAELYAEAVEVLLGQWDEAKGLKTEMALGTRALDAGDRRSLLEPVAFWLHERKQRELEGEDLRGLLRPTFLSLCGNDAHLARQALDRFLQLIGERSGLLVERGPGHYGFAHLTFQEYLAARALAERQDALAYTLKKLPDPWWREVILLQAGYLSTQGTRRVSELIRLVLQAKPDTEPEPCHHLALAADCLLDAGEARVDAGLPAEVRARIKAEADVPLPNEKDKNRRTKVLRKVMALNTLSRLESGQSASGPRFWQMPYGEPEWVTVPAGEFWMGSEDERDDEKPIHHVYIAAFQIAKVPVTNAQYAMYVADTQARVPKHWRNSQPPKGEENHPVVWVSWHDTQGYCAWLGAKLGKAVRLPTEAEWEKAARGASTSSAAARQYPWGNEWRELHCNSHELGLGDTTPVGIFGNGASPYGVLDMAGNVWEWCQSKHEHYPYKPDDRREAIASRGEKRVVRGGAFYDEAAYVRCAIRSQYDPDLHGDGMGFRVAVAFGA